MSNLQNGVNVADVEVNDLTVNALLTAFLNAAYARGVFSLPEAAKVHECLQYLNNKEKQTDENEKKIKFKQNLKLDQTPL